jgi:hypothetical protein
MKPQTLCAIYMTIPLDIEVRIEEDQIVFVRGYYFKYGIVSSSCVVHATQINEVCFKTFPYSLVVNNNEVLFLEYSHRIQEELLSFVSRNHLRITDREDLWYFFATPYLDTKFETSEKEEMSLVLHRYFNGKELRKIKRRVGRVLWLNFLLGQEWAYLGQFQYLRLKLFLSSEDYWWTMGIALRNYQY